jgi:tyrosine-protein phosphatase YwqE
MWHLFKPALKKNPFDFIGVDIHSHLLPNVDDGVKTAEESFHYLSKFEELGVKKVLFTPHIYHTIYPNKKTGLEKTYRSILKEYSLNKTTVEVVLGAEYFLDEHFSDLLKKDELLTFGKEKYVLVETSFAGLAMNLQESLFDITTSGYIPILAHPERYHYLSNKLYQFNLLVEQGVKLQVNLPSMVGYYGKASVDIFNYLLKENLISFVGTDLHHERHFESLVELGKNNRLLNKLRKIDLLNQTLL